MPTKNHTYNTDGVQALSSTTIFNECGGGVKRSLRGQECYFLRPIRAALPKPSNFTNRSLSLLPFIVNTQWPFYSIMSYPINESP